MFKEIPLPRDPMLSGNVSLPVGYHLRQSRVGWETCEQVNVVGHEKTKMHPPLVLLMPINNAFQNTLGNLGVAKLVDTSWLCTKGQKIDGLVTNPG